MLARRTSEKGSPNAKSIETSSTSQQEEGNVHILGSGSQQLHRKLGVKEVQLFALSAAIGTCTFPG